MELKSLSVTLDLDVTKSADTWVQVVLICAGLAWMVFSVAVLRSRALRRIQSAASLSDAG